MNVAVLDVMRVVLHVSTVVLGLLFVTRVEMAFDIQTYLA